MPHYSVLIYIDFIYRGKLI